MQQGGNQMHLAFRQVPILFLCCFLLIGSSCSLCCCVKLNARSKVNQECFSTAVPIHRLRPEDSTSTTDFMADHQQSPWRTPQKLSASASRRGASSRGEATADCRVRMGKPFSDM